jgi:hypothetical protein
MSKSLIPDSDVVSKIKYKNNLLFQQEKTSFSLKKITEREREKEKEVEMGSVANFLLIYTKIQISN